MYPFGRSHSGSFPTLPLHFSSLTHAGQHIKALGGFFIMETRALFALPSALLSSQTISNIPARRVYIVKKYCCQCPHPACKRWNFPPDQGEMCLSEALRTHTVTEASQVFIQGLSIDFRRWMKAGIKDGMQFVSAKWISFSASVVRNVLLVLFDHCRWLLTPSLLSGSALAAAQSALS